MITLPLPTVEEMFERMSQIGMDGWISLEECQFIKQMVEKIPTMGVYLEVGVAYGKSLSIASTYARGDVTITGIDRLNWNQRDENMTKLGTKDRATFIEGDSQDQAVKWGEPIDLLFIDGDHNYLGVVKDLLSWLPHVKHGGRVMLHDYANNEPGVMRAIHDFVHLHKAYELEPAHGSIYTFIKKKGK